MTATNEEATCVGTNTDTSACDSAFPGRNIRISGHLALYACSVVTVMAVMSGLRMLLFIDNQGLVEAIPSTDIMSGFLIGARFDLIIAAYVCFPLNVSVLFPANVGVRKLAYGWLTVVMGVIIALALSEIYFYREFQQRLNSLVFVYVREDPRTVLSMIWHGYPVIVYLLVSALLAIAVGALFRQIELKTRYYSAHATKQWGRRILAFTVVAMATVLFGRGTVRSGPPLRWGDAFHSNHVFANHLALNGIFTLAKAWTAELKKKSDKTWLKSMPLNDATQITREILLNSRDRLVDGGSAAVRRLHTPPENPALNGIRNVVIILMESFSGEFVGALGKDAGITAEFDKLAKQGLLFEQFFSNGTHTHQGMFATLAGFPNLPGYEYLMQQSEGTNHFSGISKLLSKRGYGNVYVYNGDFSWDNQEGFFRNQGMTHFVGRNDYVDPKYSDPTWGVSDEDMFTRAAAELDRIADSQPFLAVIQSLSNHFPYALPDTLPFPRITDRGVLSEHLTAMKYSDWALGRFFDRIRSAYYYADTVFVILGDHGFAIENQVTNVNLLRFHVPLLLIGPGIVESYGNRRSIVGTQVDVAPTIMGLLQKPFQHQCWGRNLLALPADDLGFGVIKPSGSDQTVALLHGNRILVKNPGTAPELFRYDLGPHPAARPLNEPDVHAQMENRLLAYIQRATQSLLDNTVADEH